MGASYASQSFLVIKTALRREMLMALMRIWDYTSKSVQIASIVTDVRNEEVVDALIAERMKNLTKNGPGIGMNEFKTMLHQTLVDRAEQVHTVFLTYADGGEKRSVLEKLRTLRHEHLAHRQAKPTTTSSDADDDEVELFYGDTLKLVQDLLSIVHGVAYDPQDTAEVYRQYASKFWAGVRSEQTPGHPHFGPPNQ
jgi:hypothetical protein